MPEPLLPVVSAPSPLVTAPPFAPLPVAPGGRVEFGPIAQSIERAITEAMRTIPPEKKGALLAIATTEGVRAVVAAKLHRDWQLAGWVGKEWTDSRVSGGVAIMGTW